MTPDPPPSCTMADLLHETRVFEPPAEFKAQMDEYSRTVRTLEPLHGLDASHMPGALEFERECSWRAEGVPVGERHQKRLREAADTFDLTPPWEG